MRIEIETPKEFEKHFNDDKFKDSFERIMADIKHSLQNGDCLCAGRYEHETMEMLENAFENSKPAYSIDKVVAELEQLADASNDHMYERYFDGKEDGIREAIEIVKQGCLSDDVCEWKLDGVYIHSPHKPLVSCVTDENYRYNYCTVCGKKINVVE